MQSIQVYLSGAARSWIMKLPEESIDSWETFERVFVQNFKSTCKKPVSIEQLRACTLKSGETMRAYIQRWSLIKNTVDHVSDERAIDAFIRGVRRRDLFEELGRVNPKTVAELMDIANKWADGDDTVYNKQARSPEEDRNRNNNQNRRRFRSFAEYDGPSQVSAGIRSNNDDNHRDDYRRGSGQRSENRNAPSSSWQNNRSRYNMSPEEIMNGPCQDALLHRFRWKETVGTPPKGLPNISGFAKNHGKLAN
jgi:hypothetical protein